MLINAMGWITEICGCVLLYKGTDTYTYDEEDELRAWIGLAAIFGGLGIILNNYEKKPDLDIPIETAEEAANVYNQELYERLFLITDE